MTKDDREHVTWLFKKMVKYIFKLNFYEARECYYFILLHLTHEHRKVDKDD